ncbi:hypothetical protein SO802_006751 [Lithocarpus litseifolius]|uniref:RNase H type-1 domain-containing protein n=1 Tax=Lithocarpus litseifolius TaxID=425828 RepID=A0AAW2DLW7_9ROSI
MLLLPLFLESIRGFSCITGLSSVEVICRNKESKHSSAVKGSLAIVDLVYWRSEASGEPAAIVLVAIMILGERLRWRPPPSELFKINFDGAVFPHVKKSGIGVVIRNHQGLVIASCSKLVNQELCSEDIEAKAACWALSFALDVGVKRAVLEGDSLVVIKGLREEERMLTPMGLLIEEAKQLSLHFEKLLYSHAKRDCNVLAHSLAKYAAGIPDLLVWMEDVPSQFHDVFQADLQGLYE